MTIVLDTNVLVSGLLSSQGAPAAILRELAAGKHHICYDDRVIEEYKRVLFRPRFGFEPAHLRQLLT